MSVAGVCVGIDKYMSVVGVYVDEDIYESGISVCGCRYVHKCTMSCSWSECMYNIQQLKLSMNSILIIRTYLPINKRDRHNN